MEHVSVEGAIYGQQAVPEVIAVASIDVADDGHDTIESQSSPGPATILFPAPEVREKPDIASFDGVETAVGQAGNFVNPFFGTSAAAPHTGAVAALMLSKNPTLSPAAIQQIMRQTAVDIEAPGFDRLAGAGRLDALGAVAGVPCLDASALPAEATCGGEKFPQGAAAAYRAARGRLLAANGAPAAKVRKLLGPVRKRLAKGIKAVDRRAARGKVSAACAGTLRGLLSLANSTVSCRLSG
jgi:hypothetical protein